MKRLGLFLLVLVIVGCSAPARKSVDPQPPTTSDTITGLDFSLAGVTLGDPQEAVIRTLGEPDEKSVLRGVGTPIWVYKKRSLDVGFRVEGTTAVGVNYIRASQGFSGSTSRGIRIGDSEKDLMVAYTGLTVNQRDNSSSAQLRKGDQLLEFSLTNGTITQILVTQGL